ncbi:DJ-1/PfpI family protein [Paenibacillus aurantius]|uniref:DJ-1/PfpI family protein n=1 Tax=Paenibacillus aurantius TaxID=2918900 RepID=A0AA96LJB0_9BACL|nr:DJ-1/PfpI family protein [Paenibacillus aurantius]WNQ12527.1 DJ-1/PfpI family protein [Paenibacillus aurantius]
MKKWLRLTAYGLTLVLTPVLAGAAGIYLPARTAGPSSSPSAAMAVNAIPQVYDPLKPTVAVMLGGEQTEAIDFVAPYELFASSEAFNVYAVAPKKQLTTLTGGLNVMPHYSYKELDDVLGKKPDVVVIPFIPPGSAPDQKEVNDYIRNHSGPETILLSICNGAENLASTGLLNGKSATTHWGDIGRVEEKYPQVEWIRGQRYVENGNIVNSAGLSAGIDASLHVISRFAGSGTAKRLADAMRYPTYTFVDHPEAEQYRLQPSDALILLNYAFAWKKEKAGVLLYDGMDELSLITLFDTYAATGRVRLVPTAQSKELIATKHGLYLAPSAEFHSAPAFKRMLVTGVDARETSLQALAAWKERKPDSEISFLNADSPESFVFEPVLKDLAKHTDVMTAKYAARRLEYRGENLRLKGLWISSMLILKPVLIGILAMLLAMALFHRKRWPSGKYKPLRMQDTVN